jgi:PAS domain S-box-containing protein
MKGPYLEGESLDWLLQSATDAMLIADEKGSIVIANSRTEELFGYGSGELAGQTIEQLVPDRFRQRHADHRNGFLRHPKARGMGAGLELFGQRRDGAEIPVEVSLSPLKTAAGQSLVMATIYDISRRKQAETALQESEVRMRAIVETAVDGIITIDEHGIVESCNPAAERLFGYAKAEMVGRNVSMLMPSPDRERHDSYLANYQRTGERKIIGIGREVVGLRKDGSSFPMDLAVAEMQLGERRMFTGMVRDISERKQTEEALRQSQNELRQLAAHQEKLKEEERKRIAQEIHDELGGLLTSIKAYVSVANDRAVNAGARPDQLLLEAAALADSAISAVRKVITDLRPSVLDQLGIWAALEWYASQIEERSGIVCQCTIGDAVQAIDIGPERSTMLFRVVQEALTNVVRHSGASSAAVSVISNGRALSVRVQDNGKGINTERLLNRESWGILGMYERTRHFGGELKISGTPGQGTAVVLDLPLEKNNVG